MKTIVILGAGQFGRTASLLLNKANLQLIAYGDNSPALQGQAVKDVPIFSIEHAVSLQPDCILIGVTDEERTEALHAQALASGFQGEFLLLRQLYQSLDLRSATLHRLATRLHQRQVPGAVAELGVYRGDLAWQLNDLFPDRTLYLFDTFEGFDPQDLAKETELGCSHATQQEFADTNIELVRSRLPYPSRAVFRKGYFPDTASGLERETYALVSLDADLYAPLLAGLEYFYPRLAPGGAILLHDYNNQRFRGAAQAVADYEKLHGPLPLVPLCDLHGSAVIL